MHLEGNAEPAESGAHRCAGLPPVPSRAESGRQHHSVPLHRNDKHYLVVYRLPDCTEGNIEQLDQQLRLLSYGVQQESSVCKQPGEKAAREWAGKSAMSEGDTSKANLLRSIPLWWGCWTHRPAVCSRKAFWRKARPGDAVVLSPMLVISNRELAELAVGLAASRAAGVNPAGCPREQCFSIFPWRMGTSLESKTEIGKFHHYCHIKTRLNFCVFIH